MDTGGMFAALAANDKYHATARAYLRTPHLRLLTTSAVIGELYTLVLRRVGYSAASGIVRRLRSDATVDIWLMEASLERETWAALDEYAGVPLSYVDASLVALGKRLRITVAFSFDEDLRNAGLTTVPS